MRYAWPVLLMIIGMVFLTGTIVLIKHVREETTTGSRGENIIALLLGVVLTLGAFGSGYHIWPSSVSDQTVEVKEKPVSGNIANNDDNALPAEKTTAPPVVYSDKNSENTADAVKPEKPAILHDGGNKLPTVKISPSGNSDNKGNSPASAVKPGKSASLPLDNKAPKGEITPPPIVNNKDSVTGPVKSEKL